MFSLSWVFHQLKKWELGNWELMLCSILILLSVKAHKFCPWENGHNLRIISIVRERWLQGGGGRVGPWREPEVSRLCNVVLLWAWETRQPGPAQQQFYTQRYLALPAAGRMAARGEGSGGYLHMTGWQCVDIITHPANSNENSQFTQFSHSSILLTFRQLSRGLRP